MENFTNEETNLINSLNKPINYIDMTLVDSIINKILKNNDYYKLLNFFNNLYDFAKIPENVVDKLISENNKECIAEFLENEASLYFFNAEEKNKLKTFLNVLEINVRLDKSYDYYYKMLYDQGVRVWHCDIINTDDNIIEHEFTRYNKLIRLKLKEIKSIGVIVSCIIYSNYKLSEEEQILKGIDYINRFGFNIEKNINNKNIIKKI